MNEVVIKSKETKEGVSFRVLKDDKFVFMTIPFQNYYYIKSKDFLSYEEEFRKKFRFCIAKTETLGQFTKIYLNSNWMRNKTRLFWEAMCNTYEADIMANKRFLLDKNITLNNIDIPYTFYDIETDDRLPLQKDDRGNVIPQSRIVSFAAKDNKGEVVYFELSSDTDEDEIALLQLIIRYFANYGIISGWYSVPFDMPYIKGRCDKFGIDYQILDFVNHVDYQEMFKKYDRKSRDSYSLNNISNEVLNESKIDQAKGNGAIWNTWLNDKEQLRKYNIEDANLIYKINKEVMFIEVSMKRADNAGCHIQSTMNNSDSGDYLLMREYKAANIIMPSKPTKEEAIERKAQGKIGGGYTTCFNPGLHMNVQIWDFKSEYPSAIQTWNISPESYVETIHDEKAAAAVDRTKYIVTPHDFEGVYHPARVYKKEEGVIPRVVRTLVEKRDKIKYPMQKYERELLKDGTKNPDYDPAKYKQLYLEQYALKTDGNSIYGILAFPMSRYYSWELGDSVTTCARATLKACYDKVEEWGCEVIGGDTDSSFVLLGPHHTKEEIDKKYVDFLKTWADACGCLNNKLVFEWENQYDKMFFVKKKHYAFQINGKNKIKGMEAIKSDTNKKAAEMQKKFVFDLLDGKYDKEEWRGIIEDLYNKVYNQEMTSAELLLVKGLSKMPKDYIGPVIAKKTGKPKIKADGTIQMKAIPAHVKLAERLISKGMDIMVGMKMQYIVVKDKPILALSLDEYSTGEGTFKWKHKKKGEIDYEWEGGYEAKYYWERIMKPLIKVMYTYHKGLPDYSWNLTKSQLNKMVKSIATEEEDE